MPVAAPRVRVRTPSSPSAMQRHTIVYRSPNDIVLGDRRLQNHSQRQLRALVKTIDRFGFPVPVILDRNGVLVCGHARVTAAKSLGLTEIPTISVAHLTDEEVRAFAIAENKLAKMSDWNRKAVKAEFEFLTSFEINFDTELTGFEMPEIELLLAGDEDQAENDADDNAILAQAIAVSQIGDVWESSDDRLSIICGNSRSAATYNNLLQGRLADLVVTDAPYNCSITKFAGGGGKAPRREFHEASGEMTDEEFRQFLSDQMTLCSEFSRDGSLHYGFMDWRNVSHVIDVGRTVFGTFVNLGVWRKTTGGMGGLYRSAHELCPIFKKGDTPHINNVQLGRFGRNRSNVWTHQGANTFRRGRDADLEAHPTVKPVELIKDIIKDASNLNDLVLDVFLGSGTTLLAAHRTGRRGAGIEIDPLYVDVAIRRIQKATGVKFVHRDTRQRFEDRAAELGA
ncbi:site-specific DNA-methyltransferase [Brevundimonas subvibrioides]|uniref:site-specific DNA-methyltransferase n=1 Tax=Brevundimonas subvibrioides TaxID=74313 RepID=UPI0022B34A4C|nr:DNA methyltransferase [Brevundimonas subvibrioides]